MNAKVDMLYRKLEKLNVSQSTPTLVAIVTHNTLARPFCKVCRINGHDVGECQMVQVGTNPDDINHVNNQRGNPYSNTYNPG